MYTIKSILAGIDGSNYDANIEDRSLEIAQIFKSRLCGFHAYQAKMHRMRFENMESGLPAKYQEENNLQHLRDTHDDLISVGIRNISLSYLRNLERRAAEAELEYNSRVAEGRNYVEILNEIAKDDYELLVVGARGLGNAAFGSVAEKVTWLLKNRNLLIARGKTSYKNSLFAVCVDGSDELMEASMRSRSMSPTRPVSWTPSRNRGLQ